MNEINLVTQFERLFLDQVLFGVASKIVGRYHFTTEKIGLGKFEVTFKNKNDESNTLLQVNLLKNKELVLSLDILETVNNRTLSFAISEENEFNFLYFCIIFKFFYQYIKQNTNYEKLILRTTRYKSYVFKKHFGFSVMGFYKNNFYLHFSTNESLQNIWEEYYGTNLEENLHNFVLPVDAGGFVPGNIKLQKPNEVSVFSDFKKTERLLCRKEELLAEIKIGYDLYPISIRDLSKGGISFATVKSPDRPSAAHVQLNHIYSVWINDDKLNISWTNLTVQILWKNENNYGCRILENTAAWQNFISSMKVSDHQRLTFTDNYLN